MHTSVGDADTHPRRHHRLHTHRQTTQVAWATRCARACGGKGKPAIGDEGGDRGSKGQGKPAVGGTASSASRGPDPGP